MKKYILFFLCAFTLSFNAKAQDGFESILLGGTADANKLMQGYFSPAMEGFINSMNNGWYHTAKVHKVLGFDVSIGANLAMIPSAKEVFTVSGLTTVQGGTYTGPTFTGGSKGKTLTINKIVNGNNLSTSLTMPGGIKDDLPINGVPTPVAQLNLGLPMKFEAMVRFFPETNIGEDGGKLKMLGVGLKKEITSWFGPLDKLPLHVSLMAAYTTMDITYGGFDSSGGNLNITNGKAAFELTTYTIQAIASLNFPFINIYGGLGYGSGNSSLKMTGNYVGVYSSGGTTKSQTLTPPSLNFDSSGFQTTGGVRLSLGFLKIFGSYTLQEYNTINAGIAFSIR